MANTKITSRVIADDAVLTANIADDAVTAAKLANDIAISTTGDLTVTSSTSNKPVVTIKNTNADANAPQLVFNKDSSSPADNDEVGRIYMYGDDDGGNAFEAVLIRGITTDVSNGSEDSTLEFFTQKAGSQTSTLTLASGNAGIGGAPATAAGISQYLTIYGGDSGIALKDSSANDTVELYNAGGKLYVYGGTGGSNGDRFQLDCVNTRLGIGTMSPSTNLHISGANDNTNGQLKITGTSGGDAQIAFLTDTNGRGMYVDDSDTNAFKIYGGAGKGSNEFVIDNSGNVGIGTSSIDGTLHLDGGTNSELVIEKDGAGYGKIGFHSDGSQTAYISSGGDEHMYYYGVSGVYHIFYANGAEKMAINNTGVTSLAVYNNTSGVSANMYVSSSGEFIRATSARRYKKDIADGVKGLTEVLKLQPKTYKSKNSRIDVDKTFYGFIAEEVEAIGLTEFVEYNEDAEVEGLHYGHMVSLLTKAIQEQQTIIDDLKSRIKTLEEA